MANLQVLFEVPKFIEAGLSSGAFQRVGGVIVESSSRQVVAWLRDSGIVETVAQSGFPNPFGMILQAAQAALSLYDGHLTRAAIDVLGQQVQMATTLTALTATGQIVNLTLTAATFHATFKRLDQLDAQIVKLGDLIRAEFDRERQMQFRTALQAARDIFESRQAATRDQAMRQAIDGLYAAKENFLIDFDKVLGGNPTQDHLLLAQHYLIRAMYAEISRIRCYMMGDEIELAKERLAEGMAVFKERTERLIKLWISDHPAAYFHKDVPSNTLSRFLRIQQVLHGFSRPDPITLFQILDEIRVDFWNEAVIADEYQNVLGQLTRRPTRKFADRTKTYADNLTQCELLLENYERLQGFDLEIRTMRLSLSEWSALVNEEQLAKYGMGLIIDQDWVSAMRSRSGRSARSGQAR